MSKPSWKNAPDWANYLTVNDVGYWEWWELKPCWLDAERWEDSGVWVRDSDCAERNGYGRVEAAGYPPAYPNSALEERPK